MEIVQQQKWTRFLSTAALQNSSKACFSTCGPNNDAHAHIADLIEIGVQNFVVSYIPECEGKQISL
jgi:alanine racemase